MPWRRHIKAGIQGEEGTVEESYSCFPFCRNLTVFAGERIFNGCMSERMNE